MTTDGRCGLSGGFLDSSKFTATERLRKFTFTSLAAERATALTFRLTSSDLPVTVGPFYHLGQLLVTQDSMTTGLPMRRWSDSAICTSLLAATSVLIHRANAGWGNKGIRKPYAHIELGSTG